MFKIPIKQIDLQKLPYQKILIVGLLIALILSIRSCQMKSLEVTSSSVKIQMYQSQAKVFNTKINKLGTTITTQLAVITNKDKEFQKVIAKNSSLNYINTQMRLSVRANVVGARLPYVEPDGDVVFDTSGEHDSSCVKVGTKFKKDDKWYSASGSIQSDGIQLDSLSMIDSTVYNIGLKRKSGAMGFFKPYDPTVEVISYNPYIKVRSIQNLTFVRPPKWYESRGVWLAAGVIGGAVGTYYMTR